MFAFDGKTMTKMYGPEATRESDGKGCEVWSC